MNKTAIKNFAIWARNKLIADVSYDARLIGITEEGIAKPLPQSFGGTQFFDIGTAEPYSISGEAVRQRDKLIEVIQQKEKDTDYKTAYQYVIEEVAYTWFNRLIAIRFMEVNDYLPSHIRVLSSESGKLEPDLVTTPFDAELPFTAEEEAQIFQLKQDNKLDEAFRILFLKQCNALNEILPALFEKTKNYTELLLSLSVIDQDGVVYHLIHDIPEDDFNIERGGQVEIIGWLYQYYNTEPKAAAFAKNGKITKEEIPAVTQLFTPDWIVRYMVENSLGRLWVEGHPDCDLKENWKYYLEEAQQEPEVQAKLSEIRKEYAALNPEDIKLIDPCMGSGHILVYAFDVLMQIYESAGYSQRDAAKSILEHNIYGLDIDDRAYQLAYFAVMMKARQYNRRILNGENTCHVYAIQESNSINRAHLKYFGAGMDDIEKNAAKMQLEGLLDTLTDAKEYGSILNVESYNWDLLRRFVAAEDTAGQISMDSVGVEDTAEQLNRLVDIGETMARKYWVTITNPPYAAISNLSPKVNDFVKANYPDSKVDLFAVFIERCGLMTRVSGYQAMITQHAWMFLASYENLRDKLLNKELINLAHLGPHAFDEINGEVVQTSSFVFCNDFFSNYNSTFVQLVGGKNEAAKAAMFISGEHRFNKTNEQLREIQGTPYTAYWASDVVLSAFKKSHLVGDVSEPRVGMATANNDRFIRLWFEVNRNKFGINISSRKEAVESRKKWFPFAKGGEQRKWYGNNDTVVNWENDGFEIQNFKDEKTGRIRSHNYNLDYIFSSALTWTVIGTEKTSFRFCPVGFLYSNSGYGLFCNNEKTKYYLLGFMNSKIAASLLKILSPSMGFESGYLRKLPLIESDSLDSIVERVKHCIDGSNAEWDSFEISWDFKKHPLLRNVSTISEAFTQWQSECDDRFNQLKANEEELNRIFIDIYGLQDELTQEVEDKDVTVRKADLQRDIKSLLSYAVGCMFGRYSLDVEGLAYAGGEWDSSKYQSYIPDADNVIPITDEEYLDDDIVSRLCAWLKAVYGADTLEANLDYIAKALGNKGSTSREIIRNYFLNDFFKDHCQTYSVTGSGKRPIYWLFDSGKQNGFKALVYLHRYTPDTIGNLRIDYLHKMQRVYESEINRMQDMMDHSENAREVAAASKRKDKLAKQLKECREYDEKISHLALSRIELDLDDGVKVNYRKLQTAQDGKFYEVLADSKNIMVKEKK
ncbi:BREX-1 system adenine-specific DNA-methyltransferase PglX [[Clostridium] innocuum]|nr:BREX-1 system adenine-specific DNA-methyltransferase PglX [[Clostridium] innocuum]MCR0365676.1 BREX-1 system adenine-specific DNA-methyltransferase PglX [[Clostridium] innocuum]MCR0550579.1 BREX-1 system adenine-specific DNA-methyltransferase PglX [[Clostridium] innocuum]MCR0608504.1 BREX-1 system adenine-specific DNA-methyltransferase PglX [[Clostridium] innocuum]